MSDVLIRRILFVGLLVLGVFLTTVTRQSVPMLPGEFAARIAPLSGWSYRIGMNIQAALAAIFDRRDLRAEQRTMESELERLRQENQRLSMENRQLQATVHIQKVQGLGVFALAPVLDDDGTGLYHRLIIGAGSRQGIRVGMSVTTVKGLVGSITEVTDNRSVVRTLLDPESRVGIRLAKSPARGTAFGAPPNLLRVEVAPEATVQVGDSVVSGALQGLFPANIPVGTVEKVLPIASGSLKQILIVRPAVQFSLLEEVQILRPL